MPPQEIEATLLIQSDRPEEVAAEIAELSAIGNWKLQTQPALKIQDRYYDTEDTRLQRQSVSLRFRKINGETKLTLKGEGRHSKWGALQRTEIELPWSLEALQKILSEIQGLEDVSVENLPESDPSVALKNLGLQVIQDRRTERTVRNILNAQQVVLAELALDRVIYQFDGKRVQHYEIEVEAKSDDLEAMKEIVTNLKTFDGAKLRQWPFSKLATGKAIEALLSTKKVEPTEAEQYLSLDSYHKIEEYLKKQK